MFSLPVLLFLTIHHVHSVDPNCTLGRVFDGICYTIHKDFRANVKYARRDCQADGGHLVAITDAGIQDHVTKYIEEEGVPDLWTGGQQIDTGWSWVSNGAKLQPQGCFTDKPGDHDLPHQAALSEDQVYPPLCVEACQKEGFLYAGISNSEEGTTCRCGDSYGRHGITTGCTSSCRAHSAYYCGGWYAQAVYNVNGVYGDWAQNQPNNHGGRQTCAVIDSSYTYRFSDEACTDRYPYICYIDTGTCVGSGYVESGSRCYYVSTEKKPWYRAREECFRRAGDLLRVEDENEHARLTQILFQSFPDGRYWIGLSRKPWIWETGEILTYYNWAPGSPADPYSSCMVLQDVTSYKWKEEDCSRRHFWMCQHAPPTTTVFPTTTIATTTTETTPIPTTTVPTTTIPSTTVPTTTVPTTTIPSTTVPTTTVPTTTIPTTTIPSTTVPATTVPTTAEITTTDADTTLRTTEGMNSMTSTYVHNKTTNSTTVYGEIILVSTQSTEQNISNPAFSTGRSTMVSVATTLTELDTSTGATYEGTNEPSNNTFPSKGTFEPGAGAAVDPNTTADLKPWAIALIVFAVMVILGVAGSLIYILVSRRKERENDLEHGQSDKRRVLWSIDGSVYDIQSGDPPPGKDIVWSMVYFPDVEKIPPIRPKPRKRFHFLRQRALQLRRGLKRPAKRVGPMTNKTVYLEQVKIDAEDSGISRGSSFQSQPQESIFPKNNSDLVCEQCGSPAVKRKSSQERVPVAPPRASKNKAKASGKKSDTVNTESRQTVIDSGTGEIKRQSRGTELVHNKSDAEAPAMRSRDRGQRSTSTPRTKVSQKQKTVGTESPIERLEHGGHVTVRKKESKEVKASKIKTSDSKVSKDPGDSEQAMLLERCTSRNRDRGRRKERDGSPRRRDDGSRGNERGGSTRRKGDGSVRRGRGGDTHTRRSRSSSNTRRGRSDSERRSSDQRPRVTSYHFHTFTPPPVDPDRHIPWWKPPLSTWIYKDYHVVITRDQVESDHKGRRSSSRPRSQERSRSKHRRSRSVSVERSRRSSRSREKSHDEHVRSSLRRSRRRRISPI